LFVQLVDYDMEIARGHGGVPAPGVGTAAAGSDTATDGTALISPPLRELPVCTLVCLLGLYFLLMFSVTLCAVNRFVPKFADPFWKLHSATSILAGCM